jgi:hypothetical protein
MMKPYHLDPKSYILNSPIFNIYNVNTPLLSYLVKNDVQNKQAAKYDLYLALRRMKKTNNIAAIS